MDQVSIHVVTSARVTNYRCWLTHLSLSRVMAINKQPFKDSINIPVCCDPLAKTSLKSIDAIIALRINYLH